MRVIYSLFISIFTFLIWIASFANSKARLWIQGRKNGFKILNNTFNKDDRIIWMHAASLGEFEQGRPVLESIRNTCPNHKIVLTFFSPSGYEIRKDYEKADYVCYLPMDSLANAKRFVNLLQPELAIFIKAEFWFNYINELSKTNCTTIVISSVFRANQYFFKWYACWFRKQLKQIDHFFVQNKESKVLLESIGINQVSISGDTRFDRVYDLAKQKKEHPSIEEFKGDTKLFVAGSTWPSDENLIYSLISTSPDVKFIIAPHEVKPDQIQNIYNKLEGISILYSEIKGQNIKDFQVLIIDSIGILASIYSYADICYIGGGFEKAIHNIQEAIAFGKPVIFGPKHEKFIEAQELVKSGGAYSITSKAELADQATLLLNNEDLYKNASDICLNYMEKKKGATKTVMNYIKKIIT